MLCLPGTLMLFDHLYNRLAQVSLGEHKPVSGSHASLGEVEACANIGEADVESSLDEDGIREIVRSLKEKFCEGEAIQVVPSVRFSIPFEGDALALYRRMRSASPSPYMFFMRLPGITLFGSSPEAMVQCTGGRMLIAPIAGSRRRGRSVSEDDALAAELLSDPQERAEHMMLVDLGRSDLGRVAVPGSVEVESLMAVERFSHVMHLTSRITARLRKGMDAVDVLASAFPAGAVSGVPRQKAVEMVAGFGLAPSGPYAGCIGWIGLDKGRVHLDTGIAVRTLWAKDGRLHWQAGVSVFHDTDEALAWKKIRQKSAMIRQSCGDTGVLHVPAYR
jgi:anthranilate synthase component 1